MDLTSWGPPSWCRGGRHLGYDVVGAAILDQKSWGRHLGSDVVGPPSWTGSHGGRHLGSEVTSLALKWRLYYYQVPHLTQNTNGKVTNSQLDTTNGSQEVSSFPAGDHKVHINRHTQRHSKHKTEKNLKDPQRSTPLGTVSKIFYWRA